MVVGPFQMIFLSSENLRLREFKRLFCSHRSQLVANLFELLPLRHGGQGSAGHGI